MFKYESTTPHEDLHCTIVKYSHPSGISHYHITSPFPELSFGLTLKTPPEDDTGTPHILEHLTLCGSKKYPYKDPFMAMQNRSVAHMMNAHTTPITTAYHFQTTVEKDFLNLTDLYADLVFNPLLRKSDFEQEGWRLENTPNGPEAKGVVLNEMKGMYGSGGMDHMIGSMKLLAPNTPLEFSYGGEPGAILGLTYEKVKEFHARYYSPENGVIVTSGVFDTDKFHQIMDDCIARHLENAPKNTTRVLPSPHGFNAPKISSEEIDGSRVNVVEGFGADENMCVIEWGRSVPGPKTAQDDLLDQLLHGIFFGNPGNEIEKVGLKHGLKIDSSMSFDSFFYVTKNVYFDFSVSNVPRSDWKDLLPVLEKDINEAIGKTRAKGLDPLDWEVAISNVEDSILATLDKSAHRANLGFATSLLWGIEPERNTQNVSALNFLRENMPSPQTVEKWFDRVLSVSPVTSVFENNSKMSDNWKAFEQKRIEDLVVSGHEFAPALVDQEKKESGSALLPCLFEDDIEIKLLECEKVFVTSTHDKVAALHVENSGQSSIAAISYDISSFSPDDLVKLSLLSSMSSTLGTKDMSSSDFRTESNNLGVSTSMSLKIQENSKREAGVMFQISGECINKKSQGLIKSLLGHEAGCPMFEEKEWRSAMKKVQASFLSNAPTRAQSKAQRTALAPYMSMGSVGQDFSTNLENGLLGLIERYQKNPEDAHKEFSELFEKMKTSCGKYVITAGPNDLQEKSIPLRARFSEASWDNLGDLSSRNVETPKSSGGIEVIPSTHAVNFCYRGMKGPPAKDNDAAAVKIACSLADDFLHELVREQGGAYGSSISHQNGVVMMSSFRDPNVKETYAAFDLVGEELLRLSGEKDPTRLHEAKLSIVKKLLAPQTPSSKAATDIQNLFMGLTTLDAKEMSEKVLKVTWDDVERVAATWFNRESKPTDSACVSEDFAREFTQETTAEKKVVF